MTDSFENFIQSSLTLVLLTKNNITTTSIAASSSVDEAMTLMRASDSHCLPVYDFIDVSKDEAQRLINTGVYVATNYGNESEVQFKAKKWIGILSSFDFITYTAFQPSFSKHDSDKLVDPQYLIQNRLNFLSHPVRNLLGITKESEKMFFLPDIESVESVLRVFAEARPNRVLIGPVDIFVKNVGGGGEEGTRQRSVSTPVVIANPIPISQNVAGRLDRSDSWYRRNTHGHYLADSKQLRDADRAYSPFGTPPVFAPVKAEGSPTPQKEVSQVERKIVLMEPTKGPTLLTNSDILNFLAQQKQFENIELNKTVEDVLKFRLRKFDPSVRASRRAWHTALHEPSRHHEPVNITDDQSALAGFRAMYVHRVHAVGIVDKEGNIVANLSAADVRGLTSESINLVVKPVLDYLQQTSNTVSPQTCERSKTISEAIDILISKKVHRLWIADEGKITTSLVTSSDILQFILGNM